MAQTQSSRNPYLTPAMERFLSAIRDSEDEYAIQEGIFVWVGVQRFHAETVNRCLYLCLISEDTHSDDHTRIWILNEDGHKVLEDASYTPGIVKVLARKPSAGARELALRLAIACGGNDMAYAEAHNWPLLIDAALAELRKEARKHAIEAGPSCVLARVLAPWEPESGGGKDDNETHTT